jgi:polysaccharide biosynthesis/export protein
VRFALIVSMFLTTSTLSLAQDAGLPKEAGQKVHQLNQRLAEEAQVKGPADAAVRDDYRIGPEDLIDISVFEVPELSRTLRVSATGDISLPLLGSVKVAGKTPIELERLLKDQLRKTYVNDPQVIVFIREFHSDPVSVVGSVKMPGLYQIQTHKSLVEVLAMAQGFSEGTRLPGREIVVTRKVHHTEPDSALGPTPRAADSSGSQGGPSASSDIVEVPIKQLMDSGDPKWNIPIYPGDVVKVVPAGTVYVAGDVNRPGGFPLTDFDNISAIQALSMAGGPLKTANRKGSVIIRRDAAGQRVEQKVDLPRVLEGKDPDVMLGPNDILFVPGSVGKAAALRAIESSVQAATGLLIYHPW